MANLLDYLDWRGDLTLEQAPFNEVDNLILAELSYLDFRGIVPPVGQSASIELWLAAEEFFAKYPPGEKIELGVLLPDEIPVMLEKMAASNRFSSMRLSCFADYLDEKEAEQFAALTVETGDGALYLSFRGTDDTLAGWKEDFELACVDEIPAQRMAVEYVQAVAKQYPRRKLRLGGHSKGGNLAVYAGVFCPARLQNRISAVWSNDGPGFRMDLVRMPAYQRVRERISSIVPKSSVVGMLLEHDEDYTVVDSDQKGLMQHDGFSWQVLGDRFIKLREMTCKTCLTNLGLRDWIHRLPVEKRSEFVEALFQVLTASGAKTLTDLKEDSFKAVGAMVKAMKDLDKDTREGLLEFMGLLFKGNLRLTLEGIQEETEKKTAELKRWTKKRSGKK